MTWRKSSLSFANGNCVEVEDDWRTAAGCQNGECVEVEDDWRTSTRSGDTECVEVATIPFIAVRDTKNDEKGPVLTFTADSWGKFTARVKAPV